MKRISFYLLILAQCIACGPTENKKIVFSSYSIDTTTIDTLQGKIIRPGKTGCTYQEMTYQPPYLILAARQSDTALQVFSYKQEKLTSHFIKLKTDLQMPHPHLCKHNSRASKNEITLWDNKLHLWKTMNLANGQLNPNTTPFPRYYSHPHPIYIPDCNDLHIFSQAIYATDIAGTGNPISLFYRYDLEKKTCQYIPPFAPLAGSTEKNQSLFYTSLSIHKKHNRVVAALRFFNSLSFFDGEGNPLKVITYGENFQRPLADTLRGFVDRIHSPKYFLDIQGTDKYVYVLFDGSPDMTNRSRILVFQWDGTHVANWQTDRNLSHFVVDPKDNYLLALSPSRLEGEDILYYSLLLKNKIKMK